MFGFDSAAGWIFWVAAAVAAYVYLGYPIVAALRATLRAQPRRIAPIEPTVSIVVVAYNEADRIGERIENLLALDYPSDRLDIVADDRPLGAAVPVRFQHGLEQGAGRVGLECSGVRHRQ